METGRMNSLNKQQGIGIIKLIALTPVMLIGLIILLVIFSLLYKAYWDFRVEQMCEKDGGRTVYEEIKITEEEFNKMRGEHRTYLHLPTRDRAQNDDKFVYEADSANLHRGIFGLKVNRHVFKVIRLKDEKVIAERIGYGRSGGDFIPLPAVHHTSFLCPRFNESFYNKIFIRTD